MSNLTDWRVEDEEFWNSKGKSIATRNLWISIPSLLCGFAIWLMWGIITVQMLNLGFPFTKPELFTLAAIAGLTGATLRIPSSFMIRLAGGRNTIFFTTALLMLPCIGAAYALQSKDTPLLTFQLLAFLSGFGGGNFASSMSNISFFFPKKVQGSSLGLNAGLGNFGVTTMQILIPLVMTFALLGPISGDPMELVNTSGTLIGKIPAGSETWLQNAGFVWFFLLIPLAFAGWFGMNNLVVDHVSPGIPNALACMGNIAYLLILAFICAAIGLYFILPPPIGISVSGSAALIVKNKWLILPLVCFSTLMLMRYATPGPIKESLKRQFKIFNNKHTWIMTIIYTMTFGSFIGYSAAAPLSIKVIFGFQHIPDAMGVMTHTTLNANGPSALSYAWMGPFVGALIRPIGGMIADKLGGAKVTQWSTIIMILSALGCAYYMKAAYLSETPEIFFPQFMVLFIILFATTGVGNGSTFRTIAMVFDQEQAGPVLGFTSAVAAYGAFIIPKVFGEQIRAGTPEYALYGFSVFYFVCLVLNYWYYLGPKRDYDNP